MCSSSADALDSPGGRLQPYPGTHTVLAGDVSTVADEVDAIIQANFNEDHPKAQKSRKVTTSPDRHSSSTRLKPQPMALLIVMICSSHLGATSEHTAWVGGAHPKHLRSTSAVKADQA